MDDLHVSVKAPVGRRFYRQHGWCVGDRRLPPALVASAREVVERHDSSPLDRVASDALRRYLGEQEARRSQYVALQYPEVLALARDPAVGQVAAKLLDVSVVRLFNSALIRKEPGPTAKYGRVGWHCDQAYWPTCTSARMITAWIPLQDSTAEMGTLTVLDASHAWPDQGVLAEVYRGRTFVTDDHDELQAAIEGAVSAVRPIPLVLESGQVSFHHPRTIHGSGENRTDRPRLAISLHLQDGDNRYRRVAAADGSTVEYTHDRLVRRTALGEPDYSDPEICPVVWDASTDR